MSVLHYKCSQSFDINLLLSQLYKVLIHDNYYRRWQNMFRRRLITFFLLPRRGGESQFQVASIVKIGEVAGEGPESFLRFLTVRFIRIHRKRIELSKPCWKLGGEFILTTPIIFNCLYPSRPHVQNESLSATSLLCCATDCICSLIPSNKYCDVTGANDPL